MPSLQDSKDPDKIFLLGLYLYKQFIKMYRKVKCLILDIFRTVITRSAGELIYRSSSIAEV